MQLFIKSNSRTVTLAASKEDSVLQLKRRIEEKEGIPLAAQILTCSSRSLQNHMSLGECNIDNNATLLLSLGLAGGVQIHVKAIGRGEPLALEMELSDTIECLKSKIEELQGISSADLKLSYRGKSLSNESVLSTIKQLESKGQVTFLMTKKKSSAPSPKLEEKKETKTPEPALCANNCGFYGTDSNGGYCSTCFRELGLVSENASKTAVEVPELPKPEIEEEPKDPADIQTDLTQCWTCKRKVGLLGFQCKCKYTFCAEHRYSDKHNCTFDYQARERVNLVKKLEKVEDRKGLHN